METYTKLQKFKELAVRHWWLLLFLTGTAIGFYGFRHIELITTYLWRRPLLVQETNEGIFFYSGSDPQEALRILRLARTRQPDNAIDKKKEELSNIAAISFHFANQDQIRSFYNDYFKEPTIEQLVSEKSSELSGDVRGSLPKVLEAVAGGKDIKKWISTIKIPDISVNEMFRRYQKQTIANNQVTIGLEVLDVDLTSLERFNKIMQELKSDFDLTINSLTMENKQMALRERAAEKTLERLEKVSGWVLIDGAFKIEEFSSDYYRLVYAHPVSNYLPVSHQTVVIACMVKKSALNEQYAGNYAQSIGETIPLKIYGKIWQPLNRSTGNMTVQITPLAIY